MYIFATQNREEIMESKDMRDFSGKVTENKLSLISICSGNINVSIVNIHLGIWLI
jgi:hypothetical protein